MTSLDPELAALVANLPRLDMSDIEAARAALRAMSDLSKQLGSNTWADGLTIGDHSVTRATEPDVPVRVYSPVGHEGDMQPALVYFHGGAFALGDLDMVDGLCAGYAKRLPGIVVSVDYRLAPEHPYPAGVEDCYTALEWTASNAEEFGIDVGRIAVGGASAGGGLAAAVALMARDRGGPAIRFQLLNYPVIDNAMETASMQTFRRSQTWDGENTAHMWRHYLDDSQPGAETHAYASPARAVDLAGLPPAYVLTCEFDPLRDEGIVYALRLLQAGVAVELRNAAGTFHGFDAFPTAVAYDALAEQVRALRRGLV